MWFKVVRFTTVVTVIVMMVSWAILEARGAFDDWSGLRRDVADGNWAMLGVVILLAIVLVALVPELVKAARAITGSPTADSAQRDSAPTERDAAAGLPGLPTERDRERERELDHERKLTEIRHGESRQPEPLIEIDPDGTMQRLTITNRGPRDRFRARVEQLDGTGVPETAYDLPWRNRRDDLWLELNTHEPGTVDVADIGFPDLQKLGGGRELQRRAWAGEHEVLFQSQGRDAFPRTLVADQRVQMKIAIYRERAANEPGRPYELWFDEAHQMHFEASSL